MTPTIRLENLKILLKKLEQEKGLNSFAKIGREYDLNPSYLSQLINGSRDLGERAARNIEQKIGLPVFYLDKQSEVLIPNYRRVDDWDSNTLVDDDEVEIVFYKSLEFACGHGKCGEVTEQEWRRLRFSRYTLNNLNIQTSNAFAATARDSSMKPLIDDGDTIFVDKGRTKIKDGKVYAIEHGGLFLCKRLYNLPNGGVRIVSDNHEEYAEIALDYNAVVQQEFKVIGWVFSISKLAKW